MIISPYLVTYITICIYLVSCIFGITGMLLRKNRLEKAGCWLAVLAFFCQTLALILGFHRNEYGALSIGAYLQLLAWFFLLCGIGAWWRLKEDSILLFAAPCGLILFLMSPHWLDAVVNLPDFLSSPFYTLHIGALFLSLGLLFIAFLSGIIFIFIEKKLKNKKSITGFWKNMPSLLLLDNINSVCVLSAFPLYTIGLITGLIWSQPVYGRTISGDPKEFISLVIWVLLAILFHNRLAKGWKGRKPAIFIIFIFILSLFSIFFINFLVSSHHAFIKN